jgi:predicted transcriptional regulator|tara:strand:- start:256 stop:411 length:156 start_codon:yes stop_codon:yes gene_type:complete
MNELELLRTHVSKLKKVVEDKDLTIQKLREELAKARQTDNDKPRWVEVDNV